MKEDSSILLGGLKKILFEGGLFFNLGGKRRLERKKGFF